jgi:negative regulator of flagellin synthesis FlgM
MQIQGTVHIHTAQSINAPHRMAAPQTAAAGEAFSPVDQVDISHEADLASRLQDVPDVRADRVASIRAEIEAGTYETDAKLDLAVSRLLDEIG